MTTMNVLVIGNGGREHALAWKLAQSSKVSDVFVAPGNAGTAGEPKCTNVPIQADDIPALLAWAKDHAIGLTVVGPEAPLALGIVDRFQAEGLPCFGPSAQAAQLESSKAFAKAFMLRHGIPTAQSKTVTDVASGLDFIDTLGLPAVIKADGLAAGKGVVIAQTRQEAQTTLEQMLGGHAFGEAGHQVVIEEYLSGEEASFIVVASGDEVLPLATSQDHKRRDNDDQGPNTGGMGAYSPAPVVDDALADTIMAQVIRPTMAGLNAEGIPFCGFLYAGIMITETGPRVLEFNVRFGDPETQPILMRLQSDLVPILESALNGTLKDSAIQWDPRVALGVVLAAEGYPGAYEKGRPILGLDGVDTDDIKVFHAGTALDEHKQVVSAGGRVLCLVALGKDTHSAQLKAYAALGAIEMAGGFYRTDIGQRAINRQLPE